MDLDFTALNNLGRPKEADQHKKPEEKKPQEEVKSIATRNLDRKADMIEEAKKIYKEHQEARKQSQTLQWEIMKGINNGEDIKKLFLKAVKTISLMTGTDVFYTQIERQIKEKY